MSTWLEWFQRALSKYPSPQACYDTYKAYHAPLYDAVVRACPPPAKLVEVGAGIGFAARALNERAYLVTCLEPDQDVALFTANLGHERLVARWYPYTLGQATVADDLDRPYDVATCLGLLEHHEYPDRLVMLGQLALLAPVVVVAIPSPLGLEVNPPDMGEQAIGLDELAAEVEAAGLEVVEAFGWGTAPGHEGQLSFCVVGRCGSVQAETGPRTAP